MFFVKTSRVILKAITSFPFLKKLSDCYFTERKKLSCCANIRAGHQMTASPRHTIIKKATPTKPAKQNIIYLVCRGMRDKKFKHFAYFIVLCNGKLSNACLMYIFITYI